MSQAQLESNEPPSALDYDKEKESEILNELSDILKSRHLNTEDAVKLSKFIVSNAIRVRPPEKEGHNFTSVAKLTMHPSGRGGGKSIKAGNITLNMGKLMEAISSGAFSLLGAYQVPWLAPMAFIILWNSLWRAVEVEITENDASIIWSMWVYRDRESNEIPNSGLLEIVNGRLRKYERSEITQKDLEHSLSNLEKIKCIRRAKNSPDNWWLRESVRPIYR